MGKEIFCSDLGGIGGRAQSYSHSGEHFATELLPDIYPFQCEVSLSFPELVLHSLESRKALNF